MYLFSAVLVLVFETSTPELLMSKKIIFLFFRIPNSRFPLEIEVFKKKYFFNFRIPNSEFPLKIDFQKKLFFCFFGFRIPDSLSKSNKFIHRLKPDSKFQIPSE